MRIHRVTHPTLGPSTWKEIEAAQKKIFATTGKRTCSWCGANVSRGRRTRCGKSSCDELLWRAQQPNRVAHLTLRRDPVCKLCLKKPSTEADHVIPVSLGGTGDLSNMRGLCCGCHADETARLRREKKSFVARSRVFYMPPARQA